MACFKYQPYLETKEIAKTLVRIVRNC